MSYNTKQSKMVFDILLENKDRHLTADEIFEKLRKSGESVGKTTIYRHLEKLCASGEVRKFTGGDGDSACYQYAGKTPNAASTTTSNAPNAASSYTPNANF